MSGRRGGRISGGHRSGGRRSWGQGNGSTSWIVVDLSIPPPIIIVVIIVFFTRNHHHSTSRSSGGDDWSEIRTTSWENIDDIRSFARGDCGGFVGRKGSGCGWRGGRNTSGIVVIVQPPPTTVVIVIGGTRNDHSSIRGSLGRLGRRVVGSNRRISGGKVSGIVGRRRSGRCGGRGGWNTSRVVIVPPPPIVIVIVTILTIGTGRKSIRSKSGRRNSQ
jgi:hypothetical protein